MKTARSLIPFLCLALLSCAGRQAQVPAIETETQGEILAATEAENQPELVVMNNERMLVVEAKGDPNMVGPKAFGLLFQLYYQMKDTPKGFVQAPPRARWPVSLEEPKSEWVGFYALPVPESVVELPPYQADPDMKASLTTWEYGTVAQITHIGPYDREEPTIARLKAYILERGYEIAGPHEEEYLKGPTAFGQGNPEEYVTIIRYQVGK
jgi:hypothetical protein